MTKLHTWRVGDVMPAVNSAISRLQNIEPEPGRTDDAATIERLTAERDAAREALAKVLAELEKKTAEEAVSRGSR